MSRQIMFATSNDMDEVNTDTNGTATSLRLNSLREAALTILGELDSLRVANETTPHSANCSLRLYDEVRKFEVNLIRTALSRTGGSQTRAAKLLGVKLTTLNSKIKRYGIDLYTYEDQLGESTTQQSAA